MTGAAVATFELTKRFRHQVAVDAVDLEVPSGAVYGFLGPNGSGKTTTIRMLLGLIRPTAGRVELLGLPMPAGAGAALPRVGSLVEIDLSPASDAPQVAHCFPVLPHLSIPLPDAHRANISAARRYSRLPFSFVPLLRRPCCQSPVNPPRTNG